jgi:MrcB-like, N-terminal domain
MDLGIAETPRFTPIASPARASSRLWYRFDKKIALTDDKLANFIRHFAANEVKEALGELGAGLIVEGSAGAGNWAAVPWISVFTTGGDPVHEGYVPSLNRPGGNVTGVSWFNTQSPTPRCEFRSGMPDALWLRLQRLAKNSEGRQVEDAPGPSLRVWSITGSRSLRNGSLC